MGKNPKLSCILINFHVNQCIDFPTVLVFNFSAKKYWPKTSSVQQYKPLELSVGILKQDTRHCTIQQPEHCKGNENFIAGLSFSISWNDFSITVIFRWSQLWHYMFCKDVGSGFVIALLRNKKMLFEKWHLKFQGVLQSNAQNQSNWA